MNKVTPVDTQQSANAIFNLIDIPQFGTDSIHICKICLEEQNADLNLLIRLSQLELRETRLIVPCECSGSVGYVHQKCIKTWIQKQLNNTDKKNVHCQICKSEIFFKLKRSKYCECKFQNLSLISGCNILTAVSEIILIVVGIMLLRYSLNFANSILFRYVLIVFISILVLLFCLTIALMIGEAFVKTKKYISRIFSLQESEQLGFREIRPKNRNIQSENNPLTSIKKNRYSANTRYLASNNQRPSHLDILPISLPAIAENI